MIHQTCRNEGKLPLQHERHHNECARALAAKVLFLGEQRYRISRDGVDSFVALGIVDRHILRLVDDVLQPDVVVFSYLTDRSCSELGVKGSEVGSPHLLASPARILAAMIAVAKHLLEGLAREVEPDSAAEARAGVLRRRVYFLGQAAEKRIQVRLTPSLDFRGGGHF